MNEKKSDMEIVIGNNMRHKTQCCIKMSVRFRTTLKGFEVYVTM